MKNDHRCKKIRLLTLSCDSYIRHVFRNLFQQYPQIYESISQELYEHSHKDFETRIFVR
jgi:hypothetical protein